MSDGRFIRTETRGAVRVVIVDNPPVNAWSVGVPRGAIDALAAANADDSIEAVVLCGAGRGIFGGADIRIQGRPWPEGEPSLRDLIAELTRSSRPVVALLRAHALGGGLEMALACHYRVATPDCRMGQTEVNLGIPPGAGGSQRLPRVVGLGEAAEMIVSGRPVTGSHAARTGLVDALLGEDHVADAVAFADAIRGRDEHPSADARTVKLPSDGFFEDLRRTWAHRSRGAAAPQACIDCLEAAVDLPIERGLEREREIFERCVVSEEAAAMRHGFFAERKSSRVKGPAGEAEPRTVGSVAVIGSGTMGTGIAISFLDAGFPVTLVDADGDALERAGTRIAGTYDGSVAKGRIDREEKDRRLGRLSATTELGEVAGVDMVVEAVFEEMDVKKRIFTELGALTGPGTILASNTSYLDIDEIARTVPGREGDVLGMHFFSPANIMKLLEVVRADGTDPEVLRTALAVGGRLGKTCVVAGVCHGFIANRTLEGYFREAQFLLEEGASPSQVDDALTGFGMAMGPLSVADLAGLDIGWAMRRARAGTRDPSMRYSTVSDRICERGWFGQKTGRGYYLYDRGTRAKSPNPEVDGIIAEAAAASGIERREIGDEEILQRCFLAIVNEGARVLEENIAQRASDIDVAWVNGYGFPRHRGGPMYWADAMGLRRVLEVIEAFGRDHDFWEPAPLLLELAGQDRTFADLDG